MILRRNLFGFGMASSNPCAGRRDRRVKKKPALDASNTAGGVLPSDALYEILLRLPAKELCRLRVVCQPWRSLLSDPHFIAAHAARHPLPLIVTGYDVPCDHHPCWRKGVVFDIMDLSGRVVKRVTTVAWRRERVVSIQLDLVCTSRWLGLDTRYRLLNLTTGAVCSLPEGYAPPHEELVVDYRNSVAFGKVASTGECKVLRVIENSRKRQEPMQLYEVCTLDDVDGSKASCCWRGKKGPPDSVGVGVWKNAVFGGIVYFLSFVPGKISSFDLETEEWRQDIPGPLISGGGGGGTDDDGGATDWDELSMATLGGSLVVAHRTQSTLDLWFLVDFERGLWVKQHSVPIGVPRAEPNEVCPLSKLDDGRIVLAYFGDEGWMIRTYSPRTNTVTDIAEMRNAYSVCRNDYSVGLYTGSLLSLPVVVG
ncbi:hypothetical protein BS78_02G069400 [Paspalum vaginatum]|nr:hypothetical protein BS78_02G069400 [Paspalum vaginatum]